MVPYSNTNPLAYDDTKITQGENHDGSKIVNHGKNINWKVSTYMEVDKRMGGAMQKAVKPNPTMKALMQPVLDECDHLFKKWYEDLHGKGTVQHLVRLQSFVTRYRPHPNENALLRHIDGAQVRWFFLSNVLAGSFFLHVLLALAPSS